MDSQLKSQVSLPEHKAELTQPEEYVLFNGSIVKIHDYKTLYKTPFLYEYVYHELLDCQSISEITNCIQKISKNIAKPIYLLDIAAGCGLLSNALPKKDFYLKAIDRLAEAKIAHERDYGNKYNAYETGYNNDQIIETYEKKNDITVINSALGFDHITFDLLPELLLKMKKNSYLICNFNSQFITEGTQSAATLNSVINDKKFKCIYNYEYTHRYTICGKPIIYTLLCGMKIDD